MRRFMEKRFSLPRGCKLKRYGLLQRLGGNSILPVPEAVLEISLVFETQHGQSFAIGDGAVTQIRDDIVWLHTFKDLHDLFGDVA